MLREENGEAWNQLLLHTEMRWLSGADSFQRLVDLYYSTVEFIAHVDPALS